MFIEGRLSTGGIGNFDSQGTRRSDLVVLFLDENVADMFGDGIFAERFAFAHALTVVDQVRGDEQAGVGQPGFVDLLADPRPVFQAADDD